MNRPYDIEPQEGQQLVAGEPTSSWGGSWTEEKLDAFEKYVNAYLTIMNKYRDQYQWKLIYFDGFAGSGSRNEETLTEDNQVLMNLMEEHQISSEELTPYQGAAERVLNIKQRGFDYYYFVDIDKNPMMHLRQNSTPCVMGKSLNSVPIMPMTKLQNLQLPCITTTS